MMTKRLRALISRRRAAAVALSVTAALLAAACGSSGGSTGGSGDTPGTGGSGGKAVPIRMQLSWTPSAEFAGYIVAKDKGFYKDAGLDVTILPGGPNVVNVQQMIAGAADVTVDRTSALLTAREKGYPVQGVAEFDDWSGFWLVAKKKNGINSPADLKGKRIGIYSDDVPEFEAMMKKMGIDPKKDITSFFQGFTMDPFIADEYPVAMVTAWDELLLLHEAGVPASDLTIFKPSDVGAGILSGCLIFTEKFLDSHPDAVKKFVQATIEGWRYAHANPDEAVDIVMANTNGQTTKAHEKETLGVMKDMHWPDGTEPADWGQIKLDTFEENAKVLLDGGALTKPADVKAAVDLSIAGGDG